MYLVKVYTQNVHYNIFIVISYNHYGTDSEKQNLMVLSSKRLCKKVSKTINPLMNTIIILL